MAALWVAMMVIWLGALGFGLWWVWPHIESMALTAELVTSLVWLIIGVAGWLIALNLGLQRYRRRPPR